MEDVMVVIQHYLLCILEENYKMIMDINMYQQHLKIIKDNNKKYHFIQFELFFRIIFQKIIV